MLDSKTIILHYLYNCFGKVTKQLRFLVMENCFGKVYRTLHASSYGKLNENMVTVIYYVNIRMTMIILGDE